MVFSFVQQFKGSGFYWNTLMRDIAKLKNPDFSKFAMSNKVLSHHYGEALAKSYRDYYRLHMGNIKEENKNAA